MAEPAKNSFAPGNPDYAQLVKGGAIILDVRSNGEYTVAHLKGSINIAVNELENNLHKLGDKNKPVITCCASGVRSSIAKRILESNGFTKVHDAGAWYKLQDQI
jgi:phage shock protein E